MLLFCIVLFFFYCAPLKPTSSEWSERSRTKNTTDKTATMSYISAESYHHQQTGLKWRKFGVSAMYIKNWQPTTLIMAAMMMPWCGYIIKIYQLPLLCTLNIKLPKMSQPAGRCSVYQCDDECFIAHKFNTTCPFFVGKHVWWCCNRRCTSSSPFVQMQLNTHRGERRTMVAHLAENNFWGQIFWGTTQCPGPTLYTFGKAKICHLRRGRKHQRQGEGE